MQRDTSIHAYYDRVKPTLGNRQKVVFEMLRNKDNWTNSELAQTLEWPINTVCPRIFELRKLGLVEDSGKRICKVGGLMAHAWKIRNIPFPVFKNPDTKIEISNEVK